MKLLDRYLFNQVLTSFLFGLVLIIIVWISPELLPNVAKEVLSGKISFIDGFYIILFELPEVFVKSLPMGILIGTLLVFDKLSKDSEITAMRACGISIYRMQFSILLLSIIASLFAFFINEVIVPPTSLLQDKIQNKGHIETKHFIYVNKNKQDKIKQVVLVDKYNGEHINNIQIINFNSINSQKVFIQEIITASTAINKGLKWELFNGIEYKLTSDGIYESIKMFKNSSEQINSDFEKLLKESIKNAKNMNILEISKYIKLLTSSNQEDEARYFKVRFHQKFSQPFAALILGIVGLILGIHPPRSSRFIGFTVGLFVILLYYFIWPISMALGSFGTLTPFLAAWLPNILALIIGIIILRQKNF